MVAVDRIQDEVRADDSIQKFQGRWIGSDGWEFPVHARYVAWGIFGVVFPLVIAADWAITGGISPLPLMDLIIAVGLTYALANLTSGEVSLSHALTYLTRTARAARQSRRRRPGPRVTRTRLRHITRPAVQLPLSPPPTTLSPAATGVPTATAAVGVQLPAPVWPAPAYGPSVVTNSKPDPVRSAQSWGSTR